MQCVVASNNRQDETVIQLSSSDDIAGVVTLHEAAFPGFFLTQLGPAFLEQYYREVHRFSAGWLFVAKQGTRTIGFVAGFRDPSKFYAGLHRRPWRWAHPLALALARRPWVIAGIANRVAIAASKGRHGPQTARAMKICELSSLAVHPLARQQGIGRMLVATFLQAAREAETDVMRLTTDAAGNDAVNAFYTGLGFHLARRFKVNSRRYMNEFEFTFTPNEAA